MSEREILFRGKRVDNGEWIEGLPIETYDTEIGKNSVDYANPIPVVLMASFLMNNTKSRGKCSKDGGIEPLKNRLKKEGKEVKIYHRTVTGGFAEGE